MSSKRTKVATTENGQCDDPRSVISSLVGDVSAWQNQPFSSEEDFTERCGLFKNLIAAKGEWPTMEKFAMFLGTSYHTLRKWYNGEDCPEARKLGVQNVNTWIAAIWTEGLLQKLIPNVPYIWIGKNWFEQREPDTRLALDVITPLKELQSASSVKLKYLSELDESTKEARKLAEDKSVEV